MKIQMPYVVFPSGGIKMNLDSFFKLFVAFAIVSAILYIITLLCVTGIISGLDEKKHLHVDWIYAII